MSKHDKFLTIRKVINSQTVKDGRTPDCAALSNNYYYYYYTRLKALEDNLGKPVPER